MEYWGMPIPDEEEKSSKEVETQESRGLLLKDGP